MDFCSRSVLVQYGHSSSSFKAVNLIFHFMIPSSLICKCGHRLTRCAPCDTLPMNDKHLLAESRLVTPLPQGGGNAIKSQLWTERIVCASFLGSCPITSTKLMSLRPGLIFCRRYCGQGNEQLNFCLLHKHPHLNMEVTGYQQLDELTWRESFHMTLLGFSTTDTIAILRWRRMIYWSNYFNTLF